METFLEFLKEVLKEIIRAISAYLFSKNLFKQRENHPSEAKGWFSKICFMTTIACTAVAAKRDASISH